MLRKKSINSKDDIVDKINSYKDVISPNSVIGSPIEIGLDLTIIPVLKTTVGYLGGVGEYGDIKLFSKEESYPFAGGNGTIINMVPCGFLVCKNNDISFIKVDGGISDKVVDKTASFIQKVMDKQWKNIYIMR